MWEFRYSMTHVVVLYWTVIHLQYDFQFGWCGLAFYVSVICVDIFNWYISWYSYKHWLLRVANNIDMLVFIGAPPEVFIKCDLHYDAGDTYRLNDQISLQLWYWRLQNWYRLPLIFSLTFFSWKKKFIRWSQDNILLIIPSVLARK